MVLWARSLALLAGALAVQALGQLPPLLPTILAGLAAGVAAWQWPRLAVPAAACLGFAWTVLHAAAALDARLAPALEGRDLVAVGRIASLPEPRARSIRFRFAIERLSVDGRRVPAPAHVRLTWYGSAPALVPGERWRLPVRLKAPRGYRNPGGFDYARWLLHAGLSATGYVRGDTEHRRLGPAGAHAVVERLRAAIVARIDVGLQDSRHRGLIRALAVGDRSAIDRAQWTVLRRTGTSHLVAISGLHVGLVAGLAFAVARRLWARAGIMALCWPAPRAAAVIALLAAGAYALLAGLTLPTQRALVMLAAALGALVAGRTLAVGRALAIALAVIIVLDPLAVVSASFWLSFVAVALILYLMAARVPPLRHGWGRIQLGLALGLAPISMFWFQQASIIAPLANLLAVPWVGLVVVPVVLVGVVGLALVPPAGDIALSVADVLIGPLWMALERMADWPWAHWVQPAPPGWALASGVVGVAVLLAPRGVPGRWLGVALLAPVLTAGGPEPPPHGGFRLTVLDVGQGLAAVVRTARHTLIYDAGPSYASGFDTGRAVIVPFLHQRGIERVDTLMVSHADRDHRGGYAAVAAAFPPQRILSGEPQRIAGAAPCVAGQRWHWDGVEFEVLHPAKGARLEGNEASCVLRIDAGAGRTALLTGDIGVASEARLVRDGSRQLDAAVVVAPHHGSGGSSSRAFVRAVRARWVVFTAGYRNRFGFPLAEVRARYRTAGADALVSCRTGAVTFELAEQGIKGPRRYREQARRYWHAR